MKRIHVSVVLVLFASTTFAAEKATIVTKEGTGEVAIINKDEEKAFDEAKDRALRNAVEQAAGVSIDADTLVVNNQLVRDQVFSNTTGFVKKYDVVSKKADKGVMTVTVKADVITEDLDKDIQAARTIVKRMGRPSIVIVVNEQTLQEGAKGQAITSSDSVATVLTTAFKADGWDVKDPAFAAGKVHIAPGATLASAEAKEVGDLSKALYFLYGSATLRDAPGESWMMGADGKQQVFPVTGEYDLGVFSTTTGEVITKVSGRLSYPNQGQSLMSSAKKMVISYERTALDIVTARKGEIIDSVRKGVLENFRSAITNGQDISMTVGGLENYTSAQQFRKSIESMKSIKAVEQQQFDKGRATYRVSYVGTTAQLAEAVEAVTFKKRKIEVTTMAGNKLELQLGKP
jgi:Flagellar assembly protein T, N-terminal domain